jgi:hypothetical protein
MFSELCKHICELLIFHFNLLVFSHSLCKPRS